MDKRSKKRKSLALGFSRGRGTVSSSSAAAAAAPVTQNYPYSPFSSSLRTQGLFVEAKQSNSWAQVMVVGSHMPSGRYGHSSALYAGHMFVFGGFNSEVGTLNDMHAYSLEACKWTPITYASRSVPSPRFYHASLVDGESMYIFGGLHVADSSASAPEFCDDLWRFSFRTLKWKRIKATGHLPHGRHNATLVAYEWPRGSMELLAPLDLETPDVALATAVAAAAASKSAMRSVSSAVDIPGMAARVAREVPEPGPGAASFDRATPPSPVVSGAALGESDSPASPRTGSPASAADEPVSRTRSRAASGSSVSSAQGASVSGAGVSSKFLYLFGGYGQRSALMYRFEVASCEWRIVLTKGPFWLFGGRDGKMIVNDVYCFDLATSTWSKRDVVGDVPTRRFGHSTLVQGGYMYVFGGVDKDGTCSDLFRFSFDVTKTGQHEWARLICRGHTPSGRYYHTAVMTSSQSMLVFGGYSDHAVDKKLAFLNDAYAIWIDPIVVPPSSLAFDLTAMLLSGAWADVILRAGGRSFPAHRVVLGARSPVFSYLFELAEASSTAAVAKLQAKLRAVVHQLARGVAEASVDDPMAAYRDAWAPPSARSLLSATSISSSSDALDDAMWEPRPPGLTKAKSSKAGANAAEVTLDDDGGRGEWVSAESSAELGASAIGFGASSGSSVEFVSGTGTTGTDGGGGGGGWRRPLFDGERAGLGSLGTVPEHASLFDPVFAAHVHTPAPLLSSSVGADAADEEEEALEAPIMEFLESVETASAAETESGKTEVLFTTMAPNAFAVMLQFMYLDTLQHGLGLDVMVSLLEFADLCLLPRLKFMCMAELRQRIELANVTRILLAADARSAHALKAACLAFIAGHLDQVRSHASFAELIQNPDLLFEVTHMVADRVTCSPTRQRFGSASMAGPSE
ncbi:BTB/POZ domain-containing protein [Thecamonas trahens ATCC 50062]|uniref:BTB/POZ domain-containing protein n=1 Tax=Thecamonas trahens ATCC 50062 TaxID=461836 RepID=A0A0L0DBB5_THETB|nr:BTB/POZ domain-containing protein [Thecamonas trahens ATCC 50062]KNC48568.1 BTB/POZ domain-containing protein [Thecamonas trahens ATCC 50062]|eukprot:XP_013762624.1 BTB/POZ domain-containing protein [Thecamonas trahens ATCC 50062]